VLVDQIADKFRVLEVDIFGDTRAKVEFGVLVDTLANRIEEVKKETLVYAVVKVEADAVVETPPGRRSVKGQRTCQLTGRCGGQGAGVHTDCQANRSGIERLRNIAEME